MSAEDIEMVRLMVPVVVWALVAVAGYAVTFTARHPVLAVAGGGAAAGVFAGFAWASRDFYLAVLVFGVVAGLNALLGLAMGWSLLPREEPVGDLRTVASRQEARR